MTARGARRRRMKQYVEEDIVEEEGWEVVDEA